MGEERGIQDKSGEVWGKSGEGPGKSGEDLVKFLFADTGAVNLLLTSLECVQDFCNQKIFFTTKCNNNYYCTT